MSAIFIHIYHLFFSCLWVGYIINWNLTNSVCPGIPWVWHKTVSDREPWVLKIWGVVGGTPSLILLSSPLWLRVEVPIRVPAMGWIGRSA